MYSKYSDSDLVADFATNNYCYERKLLTQLLNKECKYNKKDDWEELFITENNLERELENHRFQMENEQNEFEKNMRTNINPDFFEETTNDYIYDLGLGKIQILEPDYLLSESRGGKIYSFSKCGLELKEVRFTLTNGMDVVNKIYLELELDFDELSKEEKVLFLMNTTIELRIGGSTIDKGLLLSLLFYQICSGEKINYKDGKIQIPIYNFNSFTNNSTNVSGLPLIGLCYSLVCFYIRTPLKLKRSEMRLIVIGNCYENTIRRNLVNYGNRSSFLMIQNQYTGADKCQPGFQCKHRLNYNHIVKCILFYFSSEDDDIISPNIETVKISHNKYSPIVYNEDEILSFEIFDIKIYLVPFSKDFSSWEKINETLSNPKDMLIEGTSFGRLDTSTIEIETDERMDDLYVNYIGISFNCFETVSGMGSIKIYN